MAKKKKYNMSVRIKMHDAEITRLARAASDDAKLEAAKVAATEAASRAKWQHGPIIGELRQFDGFNSGDAFGVVAAQYPDAVLQEYGTGLYGSKKRRITPKKGEFLTFMGSDGVWHKVRSVAGMRPEPFLRPAMDAVRGKIADILRKNFKKAGM